MLVILSVNKTIIAQNYAETSIEQYSISVYENDRTGLSIID